MEIKQQELVEIKSHVSVVQQAATALVVDSKESMAKATDALHNVRQAEKYVEERKILITRPLMAALASARDLFKPIELQLSEANKMIKAKMLAWQIEEDDRIQKEQDRIAKRVGKGTMKAETAAGKLEALGETGKGSEGQVGKSSIREVRKVRIVDETMIPREYLVPDMQKITEAIIRQGLKISGVETYVEKSIVSR
jgi:hypothetical protein